MSVLSQTQIVQDEFQIVIKTIKIGLLRLDERNPVKIREELARMNVRSTTRDEASRYLRVRTGILGSGEVVTKKFEKDIEGKVDDLIVFGARNDWSILGYLSDVGKDIREIEYQGIIVVTEE